MPIASTFSTLNRGTLSIKLRENVGINRSIAHSEPILQHFINEELKKYQPCPINLAAISNP